MADRELNFEEDIAIDPERLEEEWFAHSMVCYEYLKTLAWAQKQLDKLEELKKVVFEECKDDVTRKQAELDLDIRANPETYGCPKKKDDSFNVTEGWIASKIATDESLIKLKKETSEKRAAIIEDIIEKTYEVNILKGAVETFTFQRKASLENAVTLYTSQYFAGPKEPKPIAGGKRFAETARERLSMYQRDSLNRMRTKKESSDEGKIVPESALPKRVKSADIPKDTGAPKETDRRRARV